MEVSIVAEKASVYERADEDFPIIGEVAHGARVHLGKFTYRRAWLEITLQDGRKGFVFGNTPIRAEPMQHYIVISEPWTVYAERRFDGPVLRTVEPGEIVACGAITTIPSGTWIEVALKEGTFGYVKANSKAQRIAWSTIAQDEATLHEKPDAASPVLRKLADHHVIGVGPLVDEQTSAWLRAVLPDGTDGFLPAETQVQRIDVVHVETKLPISAGKCIRCHCETEVKLSAAHFADEKADDVTAICIAPVCDTCIGTISYRTILVLSAIGVLTVGTSMFLGYYFLGVLGFVPISLYLLNLWQSKGKAQRYRHVVEDTCSAVLREFHLEPTDVTAEEVNDLQGNWVPLDKFIFCPGCLQLHRGQSAWCPHCKYMLNYRMYPRS